MAIDPAAISARPARTTTWGELTAPDRPAAKAKGTVRPSDIPMTMSRTKAVEAKCVSTWAGEVGGAGVGSESIAIPEVYLFFGGLSPAARYFVRISRATP